MIKYIILLVITAGWLRVGVCGDDPARYIGDPDGFHGMILFGSGEDYYVSHLPMWMNPHDYQLIAKVKLPKAVYGLLNRKKKEGATLFSISPTSNFVLPRFALGEVNFSAELYNGHFERGGQRLRTINIEFESLVFFKKLRREESQPPPNRQKYIVFGRRGNQFMVHIAHGAPEIDEILEIQPILNSDILNPIVQGRVLEFTCHTSDTRKNMRGLDETQPQNCKPDRVVQQFRSCAGAEGVNSSPSQSIDTNLPQVTSVIGIRRDIYTDARDLAE